MQVITSNSNLKESWHWVSKIDGTPLGLKLMCSMSSGVIQLKPDIQFDFLLLHTTTKQIQEFFNKKAESFCTSTH
jgi:hypothetical protein